MSRAMTQDEERRWRLIASAVVGGPVVALAIALFGVIVLKIIHAIHP
jgi:hypothetical protein